MSELAHLRMIIDAAFERRGSLSAGSTPAELDGALQECLTLLDRGELRIAEPRNGGWVVNEWLRKAVLLSFRVSENRVVDGGFTRFYDKVPLKYADATGEELRAAGVRIVPHAVVRRGAYVAPDVVLMPSYVNIGAWIGSGTMVDTWATVGSCAQIGKNCHISGGAGIGGVLEPLQAGPVIIEDNCFIGARSEVAEGVVVRQGAVLAMGVFIGASTKIVDRESGEIYQGEVPAYSVVVPGSMPGKPGAHAKSNAPNPGLYCAVIVKRVDEKTRAKTSINELLRD
jgi:2,3,4,5-tetrahydropyridine-2-carboxylate N-succinyltransferase